MLTSISVTIIAGFVVIFVIALIPVLVQIRRLAKEAERLLEATRQQIVPLSHDVVRLVDDIGDLVKQGQRQMVKVEDSVNAVRETALKLRDVESLFKDRIEKPLLNLIAVVAALIKGTRALVKHMKKE
jgi:uncharacterized protein YoxC